jgi:hypothetical protein
MRREFRYRVLQLLAAAALLAFGSAMGAWARELANLRH